MSSKYYTIEFPGEYGQNVRETWSTEQILKAYYGYWSERMHAKFTNPYLDRDMCIEDWCAVHWAVETDEYGNILEFAPDGRAAKLNYSFEDLKRATELATKAVYAEIFP